MARSLEQNNRHSEAEHRGDYDLSLIPSWSIALAIVLFIGIQYLFHFKMEHRKHELLPMRFIMGFLWGSALASYALLAGYVSRDVKRRNMSATLWTLMVILMPAGIGAIVYFLIRNPMVSRCPNCSTDIQASYHFCPQCQFQMSPVCGQCFRGVRITDVYCTQCGHDLARDETPARLSSYRD